MFLFSFSLVDGRIITWGLGIIYWGWIAAGGSVALVCPLLFDFLLLFSIIWYSFVLRCPSSRKVNALSRSRLLLAQCHCHRSTFFRRKGGIIVRRHWWRRQLFSLFAVLFLVVVVVCPEFVVELLLNGHLSPSLGSLLNNEPQNSLTQFPCRPDFFLFIRPTLGAFFSSYIRRFVVLYGTIVMHFFLLYPRVEWVDL